MPCRTCINDALMDPASNADKVSQFHYAFGVAEPVFPMIPSGEVMSLRARLISEEFLEVIEEIEKARAGFENLADLAKELADLLVVTYGTALVCGIDIDAVFEEVHRSNMSKLGPDGKPIYREDGKVLKGPNYSPADVQSVLDSQ